jgi:hypothetical protein
MVHAHAAAASNTNATIIQQVLSSTPSVGHIAMRADAVYAIEDPNTKFAGIQRALSPNTSGGHIVAIGETVRANATVQREDNLQNCGGQTSNEADGEITAPMGIVPAEIHEHIESGPGDVWSMESDLSHEMTSTIPRCGRGLHDEPRIVYPIEGIAPYGDDIAVRGTTAHNMTGGGPTFTDHVHVDVHWFVLLVVLLLTARGLLSILRRIMTYFAGAINDGGIVTYFAETIRCRRFVAYFTDAVSHESYVKSPGREPHATPPEAPGFISPLRWFLTYFTDAVASSTGAMRVDSPGAAPHVIAETSGRRLAP